MADGPIADTEQSLSFEEELHLLRSAPITELAAYLGVDLELAAQLRADRLVEDALERLGVNQSQGINQPHDISQPQGTSQPQIEVTARPITPIGNLVGFASVKFNNAFVVEDLKILQGEKGMFVGMPSKPDKTSKTGYRDTAKPITADFRNELTGAVIEAYHDAVEKLQARAAAVVTPGKQPDKPSIQQQLADGAKQAAKDNAARPAPEKSNKVPAER